MVQRILYRRNVSGELTDNAREGVTCAVQMELLDARFLRVLLQILDEAM